jgi:hypothetical protein
MKRFIYSAALILLAGAVSCSSYSVKKELNESSALKGSGKIGVAVRVSLKGRVQRDEITGSVSKALPAFRHKRAVELLVDLPSPVTEFMDDSDSFYQETSGEFKPYKSLGTLKSFLRTHESDIKDSMEKNECDLLVIYEVYSVASVEMQMMKFSSVVAVVDKNLEVVYLDHQSDLFESETTDLTALKAEMVSSITDRFIEKMKDFNWISDL